MAVTIGFATCSPSLLAKTDSPFATELASKPCPQASWKITPPNPLSITTGIFPLGQGPAFNMVTA